MDRIEILEKFRSECVARMRALADGLAADESRSAFIDIEQSEWDQLDQWVTDAGTDIERHQRLLSVAGTATTDPAGTLPANFNVNVPADPWDLRALPFNASGADIRSRALTAIEKIPELPDAYRENATQMVQRVDNRRGDLARHMLLTGSTAFRTGWQKAMAGEMWACDEAERTALLEARASSLTDGSGGFAVPFTLDTTIIGTADGTVSPFREISTVKPIVTDTWNGVSSAGVTGSWDGEATEASDDAPALLQPSITPSKLAIFIPASIEITQDWAGIEADLRLMIEDEKARKEDAAFTTGTGTGQPTGIITALTGTASETSPATAETFVLADVDTTYGALPARYRRRAAWAGEINTFLKIQELAAAAGDRSAWNNEAADPLVNGQLRGRPAYEASAMKSTADINPAVTATNHILVVGDFSNYYIIDRVGLTVEFIPHLFGPANNRPTGERGWYAYLRTGADSVNDGAFRVLNVATTL